MTHSNKTSTEEVVEMVGNSTKRDVQTIEDIDIDANTSDFKNHIHRELLIKSMNKFRESGWQVYPKIKGVEGVYTLADYVSYDGDSRLMWVECLTSPNNAQVNKKLKLTEYTDLQVCFVTFESHDLPADVSNTQSVEEIKVEREWS